ncbi:hypothetical protein [Desulfosarcina ovata]|nr:hypothetical protein [Desulfosarcina ovata]
MKKTVWLLMAIAGVFLLVSCGGKYDDAEAVLSDYADAMEAYVAEMENVGSADDVAKAMTAYTEKLTALTPRLQNVYETLPELKSGKDFPEELESVAKRMETVAGKLQSSMMKTMQYMMDPAVQRAMTAQAQAMAKTGQ